MSMADDEIVCHIQSPNIYTGSRPCVFLAGGISSYPDWQTLVEEKIRNTCPGLVTLNPKRENFDHNNTRLHFEQIKWEFHALRQASVIIFWFPKETLCPITLFELGTWSILHKYHGSHIIVGCDPDYARIQDVRAQLDLLTGGTIPVHTCIDDVLTSLQKLTQNNNIL